MPATAAAVLTRWAVRRDVPQMAAIAAADPFTAARWPHLRRRVERLSAIGVVAESRHDGAVLGYAVYRLLPSRVRLLGLAVRPDRRGCGVGRALAGFVKARGVQCRRRGVVATVPETETPALCFLRACGFRPVVILRGDPDAVVMEWAD